MEMTISEFIKGKKPECLKSPHAKHVPVRGYRIRSPYCLYCGKKI